MTQAPTSDTSEQLRYPASTSVVGASHGWRSIVTGAFWKYLSQTHIYTYVYICLHTYVWVCINICVYIIKIMYKIKLYLLISEEKIFQ